MLISIPVFIFYLDRLIFFTCFLLESVIFDFLSDSVKPTKKSYDYRNKVKHHNRILLEAEPQIGKTGVYLSVSTKVFQVSDHQKESG